MKNQNNKSTDNNELIISIQAEKDRKIFSSKVSFSKKNQNISDVTSNCSMMSELLIRKLFEEKLIS
jgi:hypothetical protein